MLITLHRAATIPVTAWPLNAQKRGKGAAYSYVGRFLDARYDDIVATHYGNKAKAKSRTGTGIESRLRATRTLDIVELDEHRCHFIGAIGIPTPDGIRWVPVGRVMLILAVDRRLGTVLGYKAIFRREADSDDVLDVLHMACGARSTHLCANDGYPATGGFPCDLGSPFTSCGFNDLLMDNALIHLAVPVLARARDIIGCDVNFGPVAMFERRPVVEGIFGALERAGFHRIQSTTGTGPTDPVRQDPERAATVQKLTLAEVLGLIHAVIADHNGKRGKRNFGSEPLERLRSLVADEDSLGMIFPELPPLPTGTAALNLSLVPLKVRGSRKSGRRAYVYFEEEEYFGTELARSWELLNQQVMAHVDRNDIRRFDIFNESGAWVDTVSVRGRWKASAHSRDVRRHINKLVRDGYLRIPYGEDPVHVHLEAVAERLGKRGGKDEVATKAAVNAHAEETRVRAEASATAASRGLRDVMAKVDVSNPEPGPEADDEDWSLVELAAINGD